MKFREIVKEYLLQSSMHGAKYVADETYNIVERIFWIGCIIASWVGSYVLIMLSLEAFHTNAISFVVESSYKDWDTQFPAVIVCESKNMDRVQSVSEEIWGDDHDFTLEEVLSEMAYFRGESYHTVHECGGEDVVANCIFGNYSYYAKKVRSDCRNTLADCYWNDKSFDCCQHFVPFETEVGLCFAINSAQVPSKGPKINMVSNKYTGTGKLKLNIITEAFIYTIGQDEVPNLVTPKSDILQVDQFIHYTRQISVKNIENDAETKDVSIEQRNCRFPDENYLSVHKLYSYSACSVECRKFEQLRMCNCTNHLMPNTEDVAHCDIHGLVCLNEHYEDLSVVIPKWSWGRKGVVCDCLPSCTEVDIQVVHDSRENLLDQQSEPYSIVEMSLASLPTERYKRNVVRGKLDLVVSIGGSTGLFLGASLLSFVEVFYFFTVRAGFFDWLKILTSSKAEN